MGKAYISSIVAKKIDPETVMLQDPAASELRSLVGVSSAVVDFGSASEACVPILQSLLDTLGTNRLWICSDKPLSEGVRSRCNEYVFELLSSEDVNDVVRDVLPDVTAQALDTGSIDEASDLTKALRYKAAIASWFESIAVENRSLLMTAAQQWGDEHKLLLVKELEHHMGGDSFIGLPTKFRFKPDGAAGTLTSVLAGSEPYVTAAAIGLTLIYGR